ncbi:dihydrofolate reductase [Rhizobium alvei]|uniref:Dihydrofolate reductase n=1 Tax=Rhizobium alvei TaxID=1132659 RepID=A0ABT8YJD3_9HYPH|nr:dihydrofolate reductase [Rhizobium alvei]MDO6963443.1 dihydrofolate reductase [Rhizobium alvei]
MIVSMIVAMAQNRVIGRDNDLPWRLSTDLKRFKALTIGKPIILGRKNYDSIGRALPGRPNIVVSRNPEFAAEGVIVCPSLDAAMARAEIEAARLGVDEICVIGGGTIYAQAMDRADILHVTHVDAEIEGDTHFPAIDPEIWRAEEIETVPAGEKDDYPSRYVRYRRHSSQLKHN